MIDVLFHTLSTVHVLDLALVLLGLGAGFAVRLRTPIYLTIFMIRMLQWWLKNHPDGMKISRETDFDEEFDRVFGTSLHKYDGNLPGEAEVDKL